MPETTGAFFPYVKNSFPIELWQIGPPSDYSITYAPGVQAARGEMEGYTIDNAPKGFPNTEVEVTGNNQSDITKYNYIKIDYGNIGDGIKWYFVKHKQRIGYPDYNPETQEQGWFNVRFTIELDYWETYKDRLGTPDITLSQVTTNNPGGWEDISMLEQDILPFSGTKTSTTPLVYRNWKTIVGWQSNKPDAQDNYIIDGMRTTLQFNDTGDLGDYITGLEELATGTPEETNIWRSYIACNTYIVSEYFTTENGGTSAGESLQLANPPSTQVHNRLNYYPYKRAFLSTVDGQNVELDYKRYNGNRLPGTLAINIFHSTLPQPTTVLYPAYALNKVDDAIVFKSYPTMDFVGQDITPITQLSDMSVRALQGFHIGLGNLIEKSGI